MATGSVTRLVNELRSANPAVRNEAARQIWLRYVPQLLELARQHLHRRVRVREDEEDVVVSIYKSLCRRMKDGAYRVDNRGDLWRLLVTMTLNKARSVGTKHTRQSRDVGRNEAGGSGADGDSLAPQWALEAMEASEPTPDEAVILDEALHRLLSVLDEPLRRVAQWKLEGYTNEEIAGPTMLNCAVRTVERKLQLIRDAWQAAGLAPT